VALNQALSAWPNSRNIRMSKTITISLPVTNLDISKAFYTAIGFEANRNVSDATAAMMVWSENISVMLLTHDRWRTFTSRPIPPSTSSEVALNISCASRQEVDAMAESAGRYGGTTDINPIEDHGAMYGRDFCDPDGHAWGAMWMDASVGSGMCNDSSGS
jgi:uncharacterized protein